MYLFTLRYKYEGVAFYANKLARKTTTLSYLQEYGVISPINLDYSIWSKFTVTSSSAFGQTGGRECWSRFVYRLVARIDPRFSLLFRIRLCSARSLVVVQFLSLVLRNVDLGVASLGNGQYWLRINLPYFEFFFGYELSDVMKPYLNVFLVFAW